MIDEARARRKSDKCLQKKFAQRRRQRADQIDGVIADALEEMGLSSRETPRRRALSLAAGDDACVPGPGCISVQCRHRLPAALGRGPASLRSNHRRKTLYEATPQHVATLTRQACLEAMRSFDDDRPRDAGAEALPAAPPPLTPTVAERVAERVAEASKRIVCVPPASARSLGVVRAHDAKAQLNRVSAVAVPPGAKHAALRKRLASLLADTQSAAHNADAARLLTALREHEVESRAKSRAAFARLRRGDAAHLSCGRERLQTASSARDAWRRPPSAALEGRRAPAATTLNGRPAAADGPARPRTVLARPRTALLARSADLPKLVRSKSLV